MEKSINAQYGIYYVHATNRYATMFHTFGQAFGKRRPTPEEKGGKKGEHMKNNENEEEWIEMTVVCPDCIQGRVARLERQQKSESTAMEVPPPLRDVQWKLLHHEVAARILSNRGM